MTGEQCKVAGVAWAEREAEGGIVTAAPKGKRGGRRPGAGRPLEGGERRSRAISIACTEAEYATIADAAEGAPSLAEWVRDAAIAAAGHRRA